MQNMRKDAEIAWDVAVIGGGPAGMMAAASAARRGAKVILLEKNNTLGKKLLITGGGRCNVTNAEYDNRKLLERFKDDGKFLFSAFSQWSVKETLDFFHMKRMETKVEAEYRVFPLSNSAQSVWDVLVRELQATGVTILSNATVKGLTSAPEGKIISAKVSGGKEIKAKSFVIATGGKSRPETGSTGDGFTWLKKLGHTVIEPSASLVPVAVLDGWVKKLQGVSLPSIKITLLQNGVKQGSKKGKILFTHFGVSGPTVLNMSKDIGELLKYGEVVISLDLLPSLDHGQLNTKLQKIFKEESNKKFKNVLGNLVPSALSPIIVEQSGINADKPTNSITREERMRLIEVLKNLSMKASHLLDENKAIVTSGGVSLEEVDFKTMASRLFPNLYLVGDILNIDRPSGGFSLQLCWTTGYVTGSNVPLA
jgi:predicted Rossmann fold flavoprotein